MAVYDDLDTTNGLVRLRAKGGHGGHNGMRSIISVLGGSQDFARIRVGGAHCPAYHLLVPHNHRWAGHS